MAGDTSAPQAPLVKTLTVNYVGVAAASDLETDAAYVPFDSTLTAVRYIPSTTLTGANTETRTLVVVNKGQAGSGTTAAATKAFTSGVNAPADDATAITLSATAADLVLTAGDVLVVQSTHSGSTGLADPGGRVEIDVTRR